jgi:uncharacterized coiled-coil protein SlyX
VHHAGAAAIMPRVIAGEWGRALLPEHVSLARQRGAHTEEAVDGTETLRALGCVPYTGVAMPNDPELFEFLQARFGLINQQFVSIDQRFLALDHRLDASDRRLAEFRLEVRDRLDAMDRRLEGIERRLERLEQEHAALIDALRGIEGQLADAAARRDRLQQQVDDLKARLAALQARIQEIEQPRLPRGDRALRGWEAPPAGPALPG